MNINPFTELITLCQRGENELIVKWLTKGLTLHFSSSGWTPANAAAAYGHMDTLQLLINSGYNPKRKDGDGETLIMSAITSKDYPNQASETYILEMVKYLKEKGVSLHEKSNEKRNMLQYAALYGCPNVFTFGLQEGVDLNGVCTEFLDGNYDEPEITSLLPSIFEMHFDRLSPGNQRKWKQKRLKTIYQSSN